MKHIFLFLFSSFLFQIGFSQSEKLNDYLFTLFEKDKLMASAAVSKNDQIAFQRAYGSLNYKSKPVGRVNAYTKYRIGSVTKLFTATIILQLVDEGRITLDSKLSEFFKDIPNANKISIRQMLNHHSGIADFTKRTDYLTARFEGQSREQMLSKIQNSAAVFNPGEKGQYSNSNYLLLGYIIEDLTGISYDLAVQRRITERIGLNNTYYGLDATPERNEATSFSLSTDGWKSFPESDLNTPGGSAGLVSTPADLCLFMHALFEGQFFSGPLLEAMCIMEDDFGLGIFKYETANKTLYGHTGGIDGFATMVVYDRDQRTAVALCANGLNYNTKDATYNLYKISQGIDIAIPDLKPVKIAKEALPKYVGEFYSQELGSMLSVDHIDQTLMARMQGQSPFPLNPTRDNQFTYDLYEVQLDYTDLEGNLFHKITLKQGPNVVTFERR